MKTPIAITSDHAGFGLKKKIMEYLDKEGIDFEDMGAYSSESSDYPDFGHRIGKAIGSGDFEMGITICGSGNGINMTTNKHIGVRGAVCWNREISVMARRHNNANICSIPARYVDEETALSIVEAFIDTGFDGGRHERRIRKIDK